MVQSIFPGDETAPAWIAHNDYEQIDPSARRHAEAMESIRKVKQGDAYKPSREFPCPGMFRLDGPQIKSARLYVCDACGEEIGVPVGMLNDEAATAWLVQSSGLPKLHADKILEADAGNADARAALHAWAEAWAKGQITLPPMLVGSVGRGKTQLLTTFAVEAMKSAGKPIRYWSLADLIAAEQATFDSGDPSPVAAAKIATVLILDDIGAERDSPFALEVLGKLVDYRYRSGLPILGATNVMPDGWVEAFGDRTASRMTESMLPVLVTGDDRRSK